MTNLTSALNYGALITLSCCNAVLQIAAAPACTDPQDSNWPACAPDGALGESELRRKLFRADRTTRMVLAERIGGDDVGRDWRIDGDRVCLSSPVYGSQPECGAFEVLRGKLYMVDGEGRRKPVDSVEWRAH